MRPDRPRQGPGRLETALLFLALASQISLAGEVLALLGWDLAADAGPAFARFHPGTYLLLMAVGLAALRHGNPFYLLDVLAREPRAAACLILALFVVFWDVRSGFPFTAPIEAFLIPAMFCLMLSEQDGQVGRRLALWMHALMALNAILALGQFASVVPRIADYDNGRSSGLLGHPLTNGAISALYTVGLAAGGGRDLPRGAAIFALALQLVALPTFGARTATVVAVAGLVFLLALSLARTLIVPPSRRAVLLALTLAPLSLLVGYVFYELGTFAPLIVRVLDDSGSTNARLVLPTLVHNLTTEQFWFGVPSADIGAIIMREGVEYGIESFWIGTIVLHGVLAASMLWLAYFSFSLHTIFKARTAPAILLFLCHTVIVSGANSIAVKSNQLDFVAVIALCMLRRPESEPRSALLPEALTQSRILPRPVQKRERRPSGAVGRLAMARPIRRRRLPPAS